MKNTLADAVNQAIENRLSSIHTALPAEIVKYDEKTQLANVQPSIKRHYPDGTAESLPVINNVPVIFPAGGGGLLSFPVKQGDPVLLIFCEKSMDVWISRGGNVDPLDRRKFDLSDGIAIMGLFSANNAGLADPDSIVLQDSNGSKITLKSDGNINIESTGGAKLSLNADGKLALGNSAEELLTILDDILSELQVTTTATSIGAQPFINLANYTALQVRLAALKGVL